MQTRFTLHTPDADYVLQDDDLANWDEVVCSYVRNDYGGVVRSVTSQFEFARRAREILLELYLRDGFSAEASLELAVIDDRWVYRPQFECPLDFSTIGWDACRLALNSVDSSLAALIKANKSTKYEFAVGADVEAEETFLFNRLPIRESLTYGITGGDSDDADGSLLVPAPVNERVFCGLVNSDEVVINRTIGYNDDQDTTPGSFLIQAVRAVSVALSVTLEYDRCHQSRAGVMNGYFALLHSGGSVEIIGGGNGQFSFGDQGMNYCGQYATETALRAAWPQSSLYVGGNVMTGYWAIVAGVVWGVKGHSESSADWECQNVDEDTFRRRTLTLDVTVRLTAGDRVAFVASGSGTARVYSSAFRFSWMAKGEACRIPAMRPDTVADALLRRIGAGKVIPKSVFSGYDPRVAGTLLMAAESIRGIGGARLYTSFGDFCDWMAAVFGYVYRIGDEFECPYKDYREALGGTTLNPYPIEDGVWWSAESDAPSVSQIIYFQYYGKFVAYDGTAYFGQFPGDSHYNDPATGMARTDTVFLLRRWVNGVEEQGLYVFGAATGKTPQRYRGSADDVGRTFREVRFMHRSELFDAAAPVHRIADGRDVEYSVDSSVIYASVTAGYSKQEYESVNGRDEFNFSNTYTTGCTLTDRTLSLVSKYRADCYGIEFAAQTRGADSTDSSADQDTFFVLAKAGEGGVMVADDACLVVGAASDEVFNGAFCPMACVRANAGFIALQGAPMVLEFASCDGNSDIVIDGTPMSADIELDTRLATCGAVEFTTADVDDVADVNELVEVTDGAGVLYRGFLKEVDLNYARTEAARYKLIIKDIEP